MNILTFYTVKIVPENENRKMKNWKLLVRKKPEQKPVVADYCLMRMY